MTTRKASKLAAAGTSIRKTETVTIERTWWTCVCEEHRHQSQSVAENCMRKSLAPPRKRLTDDFKFAVLARRRAGETLVAIGKDLGLTGQRIKQIQNQAEHLERMRRGVGS